MNTFRKRILMAGSLLLVCALLSMGGMAVAATNSVQQVSSLAVSGSGDTVSILGLPTLRGGAVSPVAGYDYEYYSWNGLGTATSADDIIRIDDATGTGNGWTLTIQATPLTELEPTSAGFATGTSAIVLPSWALQIDQVTAIVGESSQPSSEDPVIASMSNGYANIANSIPVSLASATSGTGQGTWGLRWGTTDELWQFNIPNNRKTVDLINFPTQATPYASTITVTMTEHA